MHVVVTCCNCSRQLRLPQEVVGSTVRCPLCKTVFMTRSLGNDRVEAIFVAEKGIDPEAPPMPEEPPKRPRPNDLELPLESQPQAYDVVLEPGDKPIRPPRKERRSRRDEDEEDRPSRHRREEEEDEDRPRRRRDEARDVEEEEADREDRPQRRRGGAAFLSFSLFVHDDPNNRLHGRFDAEVDADGLKLWRGKGRVLEVPTGSECEYLGQGRLVVPIDGRKVELSPVHPDGLHDELAREIAGFLERRQDRVELPQRQRGPVVWLALLPVAIPLLAVIFGRSIGGIGGFILWSFLALILGVACLLVTMQRNWTVYGRAWGAGLIALCGYFILGIALSIDDRPAASSAEIGPWCNLAPLDGGYRVEMPGRPERRASGMLSTPFNFNEVYVVEISGAGTAAVAAHGPQDGQGGEHALQQIGQALASQNNGQVRAQRDLTLDGKKGIEWQIDSRDRGQIVARAYFHTNRLFLIAFASRKLSPSSKEATHFLDSFTFDATTGWPGPPTPGAPRVDAGPAPPQNHNPPPAPIKPANEDLAPNGKLLLKHNTAIVWAGFGPERDTVLFVSEDGVVVSYHVARNTEVLRLKLPIMNKASAAALAPNKRTVVVAGETGALQLVDLPERRLLLPLAGPSPASISQWCVTFSPDGQKLATGHGDQVVKIWNVQTRKLEQTISIGTDQVLSLDWPEANTLVVGNADRIARIYDLSTKKAREIRGHDKAPVPWDGVNSWHWAMRGVAMSRDGQTMVSVSNDRTARLWNVLGNNLKHRLAHPDAVTAVLFFPSGRLVATGCNDGGVRVWEVNTGRERGQIRSKGGAIISPDLVRSLAFNTDGTQFLTAAGQRLELWQVERQVAITPEEKKPLESLPRHLTRIEVGVDPWSRSDVGPLIASQDGKRLLFGGSDRRLRIWNTDTFAQEMERNLQLPTPLALSADGKKAATGANADVNLHEVDRNWNSGSLKGNTWQRVTALAFSPDGKMLAVGHSSTIDHTGSEIRLWDVATSTLIRTLHGHGRDIVSLVFLPDGLGLASVSSVDPFVRLWDVSNGREYARLKGHTQGIRCLTCSADGKYLATGGEDRSAII